MELSRRNCYASLLSHGAKADLDKFWSKLDRYLAL